MGRPETWLRSRQKPRKLVGAGWEDGIGTVGIALRQERCDLHHSWLTCLPAQEFCSARAQSQSLAQATGLPLGLGKQSPVSNPTGEVSSLEETGTLSQRGRDGWP